MIYKFIVLVLFLMMLNEGIKELFKMFKGFRFDLDFIGFGFCFISIIILYCLYS